MTDLSGNLEMLWLKELATVSAVILENRMLLSETAKPINRTAI